MEKRIISLLLAVVMIIGMFPVNVFAEEENNAGGNGQTVVDAITEPTTEPTLETEAKDGEEKKMTAEDLAALFRALPSASSITADTTETEKSTVMAQLEQLVSLYDAMVENDPEEAAVFEANYAQLYLDAMDLNDALTGNYSQLYANVVYDPNSSRNLTITVNNDLGELLTDATVTVVRSNNDTHQVQNLGNGQYAFTKKSNLNTSQYTITVSAPGHETKSVTVRGSQSATTVTLKKQEDLSGENWQEFKVFYIATGEIPSKYAGHGDAVNYGPSSNNTPLVIIKVDINKLKREHSDVALYQENTDGNQYHFIPVGRAQDKEASQRFWTAVKNCMHPDSVAAFTATGLYNDYCVYVLKKQSDGSQHADGILSKTPPVYVIELSAQGTYFGGFVTDKNGTFTTMNDVRAKYYDHYNKNLGVEIQWDATGRKGYYLTEDNAYTVTLTQSNESSATHKPNGSEIKYQSRNNTNTYYLATFELTVTEGAEGYNTVRYTDGIANDTLFPDQVDVLTTGSKVPAFTGDPHGKRPGYNFVGWVLEGGNGKILTDTEVAAMTVDRNLVFHAEWSRIPTEFTATITVLLNDNYPSDIVDMLGNSNAALYVKAEGGSYIPMTRSNVGVYTAELPNGTYKTYYSVDGGSTFTPIDDRVFAIASAEGGRKVKFNSVSYDLDGGTSNPVIPQLNFYHAGTAVSVNSTVPTKEGYVFVGWKNSDGVIYQPGDQITDYIITPYRLTAQWKKAIDVTVTVVIEHGNDDTLNNDNVNFSLVQLQQGTTVHTGKSVSLTEENHTGYEISENTETKTITYTPTEATFRDLADANYTVNCFKAAYEITVSKETDNEGNQHITLTLKYTPEDFALNYVVQMDESAKDDKNLWPQAVHVKAVRWEKSGETTSGWEVVPQHQTTSARVTIDPATGKGSGSVNVAKHWPGMPDEMADYRIIVTAYIMPDGTMVTAQPVPGFKCPSSNGIYEGVITVENGGRTPTYPEATDVLAAFYNNKSKTQDGVPTATIKVNSFDVTFKADTVSGGMVEDKGSHTVSKQIKIPQFENFEMTAPADGYLFEGWYSKDGSTTGDWGEKIVAATDITESITVYAKWKEPITVTGTVYVAGSLIGDDGGESAIFDHDRVKTVTIVLRHQGLGGHIATQDVAITYTGNLGQGHYTFTNIPNDGNTYYIEERSVNYTGRYQNEPDSLNETPIFEDYSASDNTALLNGDLVAQVNAYLDFEPASFDLQYQVDATAISEDFRPEVAEILVTSEGTSTSPDPSRWPVILQMVSDTDENGNEVYEGDKIALTDGKGGGSTSVWNSFPDGATLYEYGIRLNSVEGLGSHTGTDAPYSVEYEDPAYYIPGGQSKILKAILIPNQYAVIYDLGIDETAVTGMENAPKLHTWSIETAIDVAPNRMGYEFLGWYENAQFTGDPVTKIDASVSADTTLYAKWLQVQDKVDMTVTIIHTTADGGRTSNYDKNLEVQLTHAPKDNADVPYEDVTGQSRSYTSFYWHTLDDNTTEDIFGVNEIFSKLSSAYAYSLNVRLEGYYVTKKTVTPIVDPDSGATTYDVDITLQYNPDLLRLTVNAKMAEGIAKDLWPVSADVKINCWFGLPDEDIPIGWNTITQHENTTLTITLDETGRGNASYPVWQWESQAEELPYYYRMEVVSLRLSDGTVVLLNSSDDIVYAGGNYMATIETDADCVAPDGTILSGAYGTENSSRNGYVQTGTVTAVISTDIWDDETADHMQAAIAFKSADETMGKVAGKLLQVFDLEAVDGIYKKTEKPETVEVKEEPGYEFTHWTNDNGTTVENPFVDQELIGGKTYTYTAHWKIRNDLSYTVNYLDEADNSIRNAKTVTGMTFGNTVYSSGEVVEIPGYVFEEADVESIQIGVNSNVINLHYAKDDNGDKIPDYKQVFVNFEYGENGSLSGKTEQVFTLAEVNGQYTGWITPEEVTATADTGYTFLKWTDKDNNEVANPFLSMEVEGGQTYTFTAHWTIRQNYGYTVQYLDKATGKALEDPKIVTDRQYNSTATETAIAITGYTLEGAASQTITLDTDGKIITFYYNIREDLTLTVHHLEWGTEKKLHDETYVHNLRYNRSPDLSKLIVDIHGYKYHSTVPAQIIISANNDDNVVTIYYEKAEFQYQYQHYYDGVLDESRTAYGTAKYGTVININNENIDDIVSLKDGYALDYIVGMPLTVDGHEAQNVIKLYYAKDVYSEEGEESDGIPDKYQATVRYRIVNGTWNENGSGSADIVQHYTLYTGNAVDGWTKKVPAPTLRDIPGGKGNTGYQENGQWDHHFDDQTAVTKDVTYTLSFDHIHYTISAEVINGTAEVDGETFRSPYEYHYDDEETTTIVFAPKPGYVLEKVEVDGKHAVLTNNSYTFKHNDGNHSITVEYAADENGNGTPDKYEATVTFYVVNGTWADGNADPIAETFLLRTWDEEEGKWVEVSQKLGNKIPTGMLVAETYNADSGKWLQGITGETPVTQNAFYTYAFTDKTYFLLDVTVVNGTASGGGETGTVLDFDVEHDKNASTKFTFTPDDKHVLDKVTLNGQEISLNGNATAREFVTYTLKHDGNYSMVVIYAEDFNENGIPDKDEVNVTFYIVNGFWNEEENADPIVVPFVLRSWEDGKWVDNNPTLGNHIPEGMVADNYHEQNSGKWMQEVLNSTPVTQNAYYTYIFADNQKILLDVTVVNGTAVTDGMTAAEIFDIQKDKNDTASTTFTFAPKDTQDATKKYVLYRVTLDGKNVDLENGQYTLSHDASHSMVVVYAEDNNGNQIPDEYEATVTYYVVNGTWSNNTTTAIEEKFILREWGVGQWVEKHPKLANTIPTGMKAATGFDETSGKWLQGITADTEVTRNAVYTYAFTNLKTYLLDVTVVNGTASGGSESGEIIGVKVEHSADKTTTFTFTPAEKHALERVTVDGAPAVLDVTRDGNGKVISSTYTLDHTRSHSMVVVYAEDNNENGTPDKYETTVTYHVANGTWTKGGGNDPKKENFILFEMDEDGEWQPTNVTLGSTIPTGMVPAAGHHPGGWSDTINENTVVTPNASYTYSFNLDYYLINAVVINGSASVNGEPFATETVPYSADGKTIINFTPNDDATHHYIVESVMVDEQLLDLTPEELKNFSSYEFNHLTNHHIRVAYTLDNNRDNIPDKYQKKVTFRIIHGTWDDDKTVEKSIYVNLMKDGKYDAEGSATVNKPTYVKIPAAGYVGGDWDVTFPQTVTGTNEVIYTFTFNQKQQIRIIIDVVGGTSYPVHSDTVYDYDTGEHAITFQPYDGYVLDSARYKADNLDEAEWRDLPDFTGTVNHDHTRNHHIRVEYKPDTNDDGTADYKQVFVKFVSADNTMGTVTGDNIDQVLDYAANVVPKSENINVDAVDGYAFTHWTDASGNTVDPFAGFSAEGGMTYVFTANWKQLDLDYVIHYVDEEGKEIRTSKTGTMHYGDQILAEDEAVDITDYVFIRGDKDVLNIALEEDKNVLTLVYGKDLWKDTPTGEDSETGGDDIPDSRQALIRFVSSDVTKGTVTGHGTVQVFTIVDESKVVTPSSVTVTPAVGYVLSHWKNTETGKDLSDPFVPMFVTGGMLKEYAAHWAKRTDLSYTVNYLDLSGKVIAEAKTVTNVTFGEKIDSAPHVKNIDGYVFDHADSDSIVVGVGSNVINLYYAQDVNKDNTADYKQFFVYFTADEGGEVRGQTTQVFTLPEVNGKYTGTVTPVRADSAEDTTGVLVVPYANYAEDYWFRDGEINTAVNPFAEMAAEGGKSVAFTVHFAADANGDTTPDKYQAKVTYRIIGGFWENKDNQDIIEYIPISQRNENLVWVPIMPVPTLGDTVPDVAKAIADASMGLTAPGHWGEKEDTSDDPTSTTVAKDKDVYTFTFAERIPYNITVTVENGSFTVGGESVSSPIVVRYDDDLKIDFAAKVEEGKNYAIESVTVDDAESALDEDGSISFTDIREDHTVHVVYGLDMWEDPGQDKDPTKPGDGISDNFQIKVNYHAVPAEFGRVSLDSEVHTLLDTNGKPAKQGTVELTGSEAIANSADESGRNVFVNWTDTVTAPAPGEIPGAIGTNAVLKQKLEKVNGGSEYHYYANFRHEMKIAAIYFVEYYLWNESQRAYVLDEESTFLGRGYVGDEATAQVKTYAGYAVNPSNSVLKGIITEPAADPNTQLPANVLTLKIYYDVDQGGEGGEVPDGIPDIYQKKITFKVVNGTFSNAAKLRSTATTAVTERVVYLTLRDEQGNFSATGKAKLTAPTDMKADAGYQGGKWDQTPPEEVSGTEAVTYTYRFSKIPALNTPKTGDTSNITVWMIVMIVSLAGVIVILIVIGRKKRRVK